MELPWDTDAYSLLEAMKGLMTCVGWSEGTMDIIVQQYVDEMSLMSDISEGQE